VNETTLTLDGLLAKLIDLEGSDLHLKVGSPPAFRVAGKLLVSDLPSLDAVATRALADELMPNAVRDTLEQSGEADVAFGRPSLGRFRANLYRQRGSINIAIRSMRTISYSFEALGLPSSLEEICRADAGLVVVTGGAGSGKTTTLAAMVDYINATRRINIITLEDPIEVLHADKMSLVSQREIGLDTDSFAAGLRSALRQDPDVLYVSDLYQPDAVEAAMHAARTGHLVLASIHSNDAAASIVRLIDLGVEPFLAATGVVGSLAQRLVRKVCPQCQVMSEPSVTEAMAYEQEMQESAEQFNVGQGCNFCNDTGFSGRTGVFEVMSVDDSIRRLIASGAPGLELRGQALANGMISLRRSGMLKAKEGMTTLGEVFRGVFSID